MKKLHPALTLLLLISALTACSTSTTETAPPPTQPPADTPVPYTDTPIPIPPCDPAVYNRPKQVTSVNASGEAYLALVTAEDVNDDGYDDVLLLWTEGTTTNLFEIEILLNDGAGDFSEATSDLFDGLVPKIQTYGNSVLFEDFNGDGALDIFIADHGQDTEPFPGYQNTLVLSSPGGKLVDATNNLPQQYDFTHSADAADVDSDGDIDLFIGNFGLHYPPQIWVNNGQGSFTVAEEGMLPLIYWPDNRTLKTFSDSRFVDVNNDSSPDLILGGFMDVDSEILINDGTGHFSVLENALPPKPTGLENHVLVTEALDLNHDGYQDLIMGYTLNTVGFYVGRYVQFLINNGDGTFRDETKTSFPIPQPADNENSFPSSIGLYDIDYDGDLDLVMKVLWTDKEDIQPLYLNDGEGVFQPAEIRHQITDYEMFSVLDVYGDGYLDIVTTTCKLADPTGSRCITYDVQIIHDIGCKQ